MDTVAIQDEITDLLELHTYEHIYRNAVYFGEEKTFLLWRTVNSRVLFSIDIRVRAGLNLEQGFSVTPDRTDSGRVYVRLPAAEILSVDADETSIHQYFIREQGSDIGLLQMTEQLAEVKERTEADAIERGILRNAQQNARDIVRNFLNMAGFAEVVFSETPTADDAEIQG